MDIYVFSVFSVAILRPEAYTTKTRENIHRILREASNGIKTIEWVNVELQQIRTGHINIQENSDA